jgi:hypothetical protein
MFLDYKPTDVNEVNSLCIGLFQYLIIIDFCVETFYKLTRFNVVSFKHYIIISIYFL